MSEIFSLEKTSSPNLILQEWVVRVPTSTDRVVIWEAIDDKFHILLRRESGYYSATITVKGFLSAQLKALELLGVKDG